MKINLTTASGEIIAAEILPPTINRKTKFREIERAINIAAESFNERLNLVKALAKQREIARQEGAEKLVADLDKQISAEQTELDLSDELAFKRQVEQMQCILDLPTGVEIDWRNTDMREFEKATLGFFGLGMMTTSA
jgi:polyhydroxyalkanoate synthesis regulator phasin